MNDSGGKGFSDDNEYQENNVVLFSTLGLAASEGLLAIPALPYVVSETRSAV